MYRRKQCGIENVEHSVKAHTLWYKLLLLEKYTGPSVSLSMHEDLCKGTAKLKHLAGVLMSKSIPVWRVVVWFYARLVCQYHIL